MLEAEEVDDDYFTPVASTTLANIFEKSSATDEKENESLKYTPPKPRNVIQKLEESKATTCIFACALVGYEWVNNIYTEKGKLGFAILKILKTGFHNIILYDSNKTTLSCTSISPKLEITVKGNFISYYDNLLKYWSLYATDDEIKKIVELLNHFKVVIKSLPYTDIDPPEPFKIKKSSTETPLEPYDKKDIGSDTDSSINRRAKVSILSRMASMGQSVLPTHAVSALRTSDSSDTNDSNSHTKSLRHKTVKSLVKRNNPEKNVAADSQNVIDTHKRINFPQSMQSIVNKNIPSYTYANEQMVPLTNTSMVTTSNNSGNDINFFMSEQRVSHSELRININRISDKVDQVLDKINNIEHKDKDYISTSLQTEILQKLLTEYENKIKGYEDLLKSNKIVNAKLKSESAAIPNTLNEENKLDIFKNKIAELEQVIKNKNDEISKFQNEIEVLKQKFNEKTHRAINEDKLLKTNFELEQKLEAKIKELENEKKCDTLSMHNHESDIENKVKNIMNDAFRAILENFESNETYSGEAIKSLIAIIIKKVTIESLSDIHSE